MSAIKSIDLLKMNHVMLEEITVQSIQRRLCVFSCILICLLIMEIEFPCHNLFGLPLVNRSHIELFGMLNSKSSLNILSLPLGHLFNIYLILILAENHKPLCRRSHSTVFAFVLQGKPTYIARVFSHFHHIKDIN